MIYQSRAYSEIINDKHYNQISNPKLMLLPSEGVDKYSKYQLSGGFGVFF